MRVFIFILVTLFAWLQYHLWFGKNGYLDYQSTAKEIVQLKQENEKLSQRNQVIQAEINDLKSGFDAIEERARTEYEMLKPDETFYRILKENK